MDRIPPHNLEAEQSLLGSILIDRDALIKIADSLTSEDFYRDHHRIIYEAMLDLYTKREPIDLLSLSNRLLEKKQLEIIGGRSYLAELANTVPTASHVVHYANIIQKKATLRRLLGAAGDITGLGYAEEHDLETLLDKAEQKLFGVSQKYLRQSFVPIQNVLEGAFERIDELHREKGKLRGLTTGFNELDSLLAGLQRSDLVVLAARPSVGKTSLALDIAKNAAIKMKTPVGIFSLEMSKEQLVDRLICSEAGVDLWKMRTGRLSSAGGENDDFAQIAHAMGTLAEAPLFIDDSATANIMQIRTKARRLQAEHGLGLLVVDYLQLMESRGDAESRVQEVAEITRALKSIARELNIPVLALSQLSRVTEMSKPAIPKLSHLRESGCLTGETLITRADTGERTTIKALAERKIQEPVPIFAADENWRIQRAYISRTFSSGYKQVYELKLRSGRTIRASANHPFLRLDGWKRLDELATGEHIAAPRILQPSNPTNTLHDDELILLAHLLGDGCVLPRQPIHYTSADPSNLSIVGQKATALFNIKPRVVKQKNWWHVYLPSPYHLTRGKHHPIMNWFEKLGIQPVRSYEKRFPGAVFTCDNKKIALLLHHLWATDGNISWKKLHGRKPAAAIYYSTTSSVLAEQVQHLMTRLGIASTARKVPQGKHRPSYQVHIQGQKSQLTFLDTVGCAGERGKIIPALRSALLQITSNPNTDIIPKQVWKMFVEPAKDQLGWGWRDVSYAINTAYCGSTLFKAGVSRERALRLAVALKNPAIEALSSSDIFWDEVVSITPQGVEEVFDATVPGLHNFVAGDITVHNSIEQDADVVMFIYRKAADKNYQIDDIPADERNLAEIHIAKHRNGPTGLVKLYFDQNRVSFKNLQK